MEILVKQRLEASYELDAMATIYRDVKGRFSIAVNPDPNRQGDEYFKLYNNAKKISCNESSTNYVSISKVCLSY